HAEQHQYRAEESIKKEFECGVNTVRASPDSDNQKHWYQHTFEEHIEENKIECAEYAHHQRIEDKERDHEFLDSKLDHFPGRDDRQQGQKSRKQNKEQRDPVDSHVIVELEPAEGDPVCSLDELEIGGIRIELQPQQHRQCKIDQRGPKRDIAGIP